MRVPWTATRSKQSILKEINTENSLEGLILKLKFQYFGHLMRTADSLEKTLMLGKIEGKRKGWQRMRWLESTIDSMDKNLIKLQEFTQTHVYQVGDTIQPSHPVVPFSSCPQFFPASWSFPMSQFYTSGGQNIGVSASESVLPMNIQG